MSTLGGCANLMPGQKVTQEGTQENLIKWCAKHYNLPIYPSLTSIKFPVVEGLDQCSMVSTDAFAQVNEWYIAKLTTGPWQDWHLSHNTAKDHPGSEFYSLDNGTKHMSVLITSDAASSKTFIQYVIEPPGVLRENFAPVDGKKSQ